MKHRSPNFLIRFFTTDGLRKLLALLLACLLYWTVSIKNGEKQEVSGVAVTVDLPAGKLLMGPVPSVAVKVSYNKGLRLSVSASEIRGRITLSDSRRLAGENSLTVPLSPKNFRAPIGVSIHEIEPKELILKVEDRVSKEVPVTFRKHGDLPPDYRIRQVTFVPAKVQVTGPKSVVEQMTGVPSEPIRLDRNTTYTFDCRIGVKEEPGITVTPQKVTATVEVEKNRGERTFSDVPLALLNSSGKFQAEFLTSSKIEVKIAGPKGALENIRKEQLHGFCDVSKLEPGNQTVNTGCYLDRGSGLEIISIYPDKVKIKLSR